MFRNIDTRLIVESDNGNLFCPVVLNFNVTDQYPFNTEIANIEVLTNIAAGTSAYISPIRFDNPVRLQANVTYSADELPVWIDFFEGRIQDIYTAYGRDNVTMLMCKGHSNEAVYTLIRANESYSSASTGSILNDVVTDYLNRVTPGSFEAGTTLTDYNIKKDQKYVSDVIHEIERLEGYDYRFYTETSYTSNGLLDSVTANWSEFSSTPTEQYKVIEGTTRLISADFKSGGDAVYNFAVIYGQQTSPQKVGSASDTTSISNYDHRYYITSSTGLTSNQLCSDIAAAIVDKYSEPLVTGRVQILFTPEARPGDYVYCKVPSLEVNGQSIDGNYRVVRVQHSGSATGITTTLDLESLIIDPVDILTDLAVNSRISLQNFII